MREKDAINLLKDIIKAQRATIAAKNRQIVALTALKNYYKAMVEG